MNTEKLKELGFTKRNCWSGSDDYYKEQDGFNYTYIVKKDTDLFQESFIQYYDEAIYINTPDDFLKVIQSDNPWSLALKIGDKA